MAEPINGSELFINTENRMISISPSGGFISRYSTKEGRFLDVINRENLKIHASLILKKNQVLNGYNWLNNEQLLVLIKDGNDVESLIGEFNDGNIEIQPIDVNGYVVDVYTENQEKVLFAKEVGKNYAKSHDLYLININDLLAGNFKNAKKIKHNDSKASFYAYDSVTKKIFTLALNTDDETLELKVIPITGGKWRSLFIFSNNEYELLPVSFVDENTLAVLTNKETDKKVLQEFDIQTQQLGEIIYQHAKYDLSDADFKQMGELNYVSYFEHGVERNIYFEKETSFLLDRINKLVKGQEANIIGSSKDSSVRLIFVHGSDKPGNYFIYDNATDKFVEFLQSYPNLQEMNFVRSTVINVKQNDLELEAFFTMPTKTDHNTLLVMPHGGPIGIQDTDRFNKQIQYLVSRGFSVLRVNFRGSAGFGKAFMNKGVGEFGKLIEEDISLVLDQLLSQHSFKNICSIGASYGGYSAVMLAIKKPELYNCVVASYGIYDLPLLFNASNYRSGDEYTSIVEKSVGAYSKSLDNESPVYLYKQFKTPILLIAGKKDKIANFEHSNRFKLLLKKQNHPIETVFYKNTGHGHNNWYWEHHEVALVTDYLYRTLNLTPFNKENLTKKSQISLQRDYLVLADSYDNNNKITSDPEKAFKFYLKAADFGDGRASFNVASYYHRGLVVDKNIDKAKYYYEKAGELGYSNAYKRLGRMYMEGDIFEKNHSKAFKYLVKANDGDESTLNNIMLGRWYCLAPQSLKRDVDKCLSLMKKGEVTKNDRNKIENALKANLAWITIDGDFTPQELAKVQTFEKEVFKLKELSLEMEFIESGMFIYEKSDSYGKSGEYLLKYKQNRISTANADGYFGVEFEVDIDGIDNYRKQTGVVARWYKTNTNDEKIIVANEFLYGSPKASKTPWAMRRRVDSVEPGEIWTIEIYDLNQQLLFHDNYEFY